MLLLLLLLLRGMWPPAKGWPAVISLAGFRAATVTWAPSPDSQLGRRPDGAPPSSSPPCDTEAIAAGGFIGGRDGTLDAGCRRPRHRGRRFPLLTSHRRALLHVAARCRAWFLWHRRWPHIRITKISRLLGRQVMRLELRI